MSDTTCTQAGAVGGTVTLAKYGKAHFTAIGMAGNLSPRRDPVACRAAAVKGGEASRAAHTPDYYETIGRAGGEKLKATRGTDYYRDLGRLVQAKRRALRAASEQVTSQ